LILCRCNRG